MKDCGSGFGGGCPGTLRFLFDLYPCVHLGMLIEFHKWAFCGQQQLVLSSKGCQVPS